MKRIVLALAIVAAVGCGASAELKKEIKDNSAVGQARYKRWDKLTDDQKKLAYFQAVRALVDADNSLFGTPIPDGYARVTSATGGAK